MTIDDSRDRADTRCRETLAQALRDTVTGYGACVTEREVEDADRILYGKAT